MSVVNSRVGATPTPPTRPMAAPKPQADADATCGEKAEPVPARPQPRIDVSKLPPAAWVAENW